MVLVTNDRIVMVETMMVTIILLLDIEHSAFIHKMTVLSEKKVAGQ